MAYVLKGDDMHGLLRVSYCVTFADGKSLDMHIACQAVKMHSQLATDRTVYFVALKAILLLITPTIAYEARASRDMSSETIARLCAFMPKLATRLMAV